MPGNFGSNPSAKFYFMMSRGAIKQVRLEQMGTTKNRQMGTTENILFYFYISGKTIKPNWRSNWKMENKSGDAEKNNGNVSENA